MRIIHRLGFTLALTQAAQAAGAAPEVTSYRGSEIKKIVLRSQSGNIDISSSSSDEFRMEISKNNWGPHCRIETVRKGSEIHTKIKKLDKANRFEDCDADIRYTSSPAVDFDVTSGSGDLRVQNITGKGKLKSGSGDVSLKNTRLSELHYSLGSGNIDVTDSTIDELEGRQGSGNIKAEGNFSTIDHRAGSGNAQIIYKNIPEKGGLDARSGSGNTTVSFPEKSSISATVRTGNGTFKNDFPTVQAGYGVSIRSGSGNIALKKS